jgi:DNA-binding LacI/PurR family transcriptional regulator
MSRSRPTIIDVAEQAGVSKSTVSRVINGDVDKVRDSTHQKVLKAIRTLGYEHNAIASSLRTGRTHTIMLAIPDITNPFWPEVARGVQDLMDEEGYAVVFANSDWKGTREKEFLAMARRNGFDAIIINPVEVTNQDLLDADIPTVLIGARDGYPDFDIVGSDSYHATKRALDYLYALGHRRIGLIRGKHLNRTAYSRLAGYLDFLREKNLALDESLIVECEFELQGGVGAMEQLLSVPEAPTAVLAANDILAIGALQAAHAAGLQIPQELSIVGIDDIYAAAATNPPLTTMAKQKYELGYQAATFLLEHLYDEAPDEPRRCLLPCELIQRGSTGPLN